jgi:hypothetical protein
MRVRKDQPLSPMSGKPNRTLTPLRCVVKPNPAGQPAPSPHRDTTTHGVTRVPTREAQFMNCRVRAAERFLAVN